jgi:hypothetical protein
MNEVLRHNHALSLYNSQIMSGLDSLGGGNDAMSVQRFYNFLDRLVWIAVPGLQVTMSRIALATVSSSLIGPSGTGSRKCA